MSATPVPCTPGTVARGTGSTAAAQTPPTTYTNTTLKLFNGAGNIDGDSTTQALNTMGASGSSAAGDCNYSTEIGSAAGRYTTAASPARWEYGIDRRDRRVPREGDGGRLGAVPGDSRHEVDVQHPEQAGQRIRHAAGQHGGSAERLHVGLVHARAVR